MGFFDALSSVFRSEKKEDTSVPLTSSMVPASFLFGNGYESAWVALTQSTVLQCVTVLMNGVTQVPFKLMCKRGDSVREATEHPLYPLFKWEPNRRQSPVDFFSSLMIPLALYGETIAWNVRGGARVTEIIPIWHEDWSVTDRDNNGSYWADRTYNIVYPSGLIKEVHEKDIWHLRWRPYDANNVLPQMRFAMKAVELALQGDNYMKSILKNSAKPSGILTTAGKLQPGQYDIIKSRWEEENAGAMNAGRDVILGHDFKYTPVTMSNTDTQFFENRGMQIEEICRCYNVNPTMVFHTQKTASYSNTEQMMLQHIVYTMAPWYAMYEKSADRFFLSEKERRDGYYFMFNDAALLRSDSKTKAEVLKTMVTGGIYAPNEARKLEDLPSVEGGDQVFMQQQMVPLDMLGKDMQRDNNINNMPTDDTNKTQQWLYERRHGTNEKEDKISDSEVSV